MVSPDHTQEKFSVKYLESKTWWDVKFFQILARVTRIQILPMLKILWTKWVFSRPKKMLRNSEQLVMETPTATWSSERVSLLPHPIASQLLWLTTKISHTLPRASQELQEVCQLRELLIVSLKSLSLETMKPQPAGNSSATSSMPKRSTFAVKRVLVPEAPTSERKMASGQSFAGFKFLPSRTLMLPSHWYPWQM